MDLVCAIDLDTILPCYFSSVLKRCKRVYDAHELFCEMKEIVTRPRIYKVWKGVERFAVPRFRAGYTVSPPIQAIFEKEYGVKYGLIMNVPLLRELPKAATENFILYQGAVNEGRSFETLIPAFQWVPVPFHIYGDGNFMQACESLIQQYGLQQKVFLKGKLLPADLRQLTGKALFGITLFENNGLSNYYSLANRFFDYIHAGVPQLCVKYPAYTHINHSFPVAALVDDLSPTALAEAINALLSRPEQLQAMRIACQQARQVYNWQAEEKKLLGLYKTIWHG